MSASTFIINKIKKFIYEQRLIDFSAYFIFTLATVIISITSALLLLKSPLYGVVGFIPLLFYRPLPLTAGAKQLEQHIGLQGEIVNSIQLSSMDKDRKERYSQELIRAYVDETAEKLKAIDFRKYCNHKPLYRSIRVLLIAVAICFIYPVTMPARFWYALHPKLEYSVEPHSGHYLKGTSVDLSLNLYGVYVPIQTTIVITHDNEVVKENIAVDDGYAKKKIELIEPISFHFEFFGEKTDERTLMTIEPIYIEHLSFSLEYPPHTKLPPETKTGRQLVAPYGTSVTLTGKASAPLAYAWFELNDTVNLTCSEKEFSGTFVMRESGTAYLHLTSYNELTEKIHMYTVPDLAPLVDIFSPGHNIQLPYDMKVNIGIRCSDDYGLKNALFHTLFKKEKIKTLPLEKGAVEDTLSFLWDLADMDLLPGDDISYFVEIADNAGNVTKSTTFHIYFPTVEEMYQQVSKEENMIHEGLKDVQSEHNEKIEEVKRLQQKLMKERELSWIDIEKLKEVITKEENILEKVEDWQQELEKTIEKLNDGIVLDQESIERLQQITAILEEIASEELKQALENFKAALEEKPEDIRRALENLTNAQEELAKALKRTLEILKRYRQEEKLRELAETAQKLADKAEELKELEKEGEQEEFDKEIENLDEAINKLAQALEDLAASENLEQEIKETLENLARQAGEMSTEPSPSAEGKQRGLNLMAAELARLYETLTKGRAAHLQKKMLEILNQLIELSKIQEQLYHGDFGPDATLQDQLINVTKTVAESLYTQQTKSYYITPHMSKNLARAIKEMEKTRQRYEQQHMSPQTAQEAMKLINVVCLEMLQKMKEAAEGAGSSTGMDKLLRGLSHISQGQLSLNQSMMSLFPLPLSGLTPAQIGQIQRLAGKQRDLREALESLRAEAGVGQQQEALENVVNEMKKTEEELYQYKLDRELLKRQQLIISRLLDAQRSLRKEDFAKKRESKPGEDFLGREQPPPLPGNLGEDQLRALIQEALRESYPEEYEVYIREYFKALLER
jgi:hypothetical protein